MSFVCCDSLIFIVTKMIVALKIFSFAWNIKIKSNDEEKLLLIPRFHTSSSKLINAFLIIEINCETCLRWWWFALWKAKSRKKKVRENLASIIFLCDKYESLSTFHENVNQISISLSSIYLLNTHQNVIRGYREIFRQNIIDITWTFRIFFLSTRNETNYGIIEISP